MSQITDEAPVTLVKKKSIDLHVDETPPYPAGLKPFPENYTITREKGTEHDLASVKP